MKKVSELVKDEESGEILFQYAVIWSILIYVLGILVGYLYPR
jgi:hypothetical protein